MPKGLELYKVKDLEGKDYIELSIRFRMRKEVSAIEGGDLHGQPDLLNNIREIEDLVHQRIHDGIAEILIEIINKGVLTKDAQIQSNNNRH